MKTNQYQSPQFSNSFMNVNTDSLEQIANHWFTKIPKKASQFLVSVWMKPRKAWWEDKSLEKERNSSWPKTSPILCQTRWRLCRHVWLPKEQVDMYYWWCHSCQKYQDEFWGVLVYTLLTFSQMLQNRLDGALQCRQIMTLNILWRQLKTFWTQQYEIFFNEHANHLISSQWSSFLLTEDKSENRGSNKKK